MAAPKPMILSKTAWANILPLLITVIGGLANTDFILANPILSAVVFPAVVYTLNLLLRYVTSAPISSIFTLLLALGLGAILSPTETADAGLFRRSDGTWRTPIRTSVKAFAGFRAARGRPALFPGLRAAACSSCSSGSYSSATLAAVDCPECVTAEKAAAVVARRRVFLNVGQHSLFKKLEQDHKLRNSFAGQWNAEHPDRAIDPNNLEHFLDIIIKYLPEVIRIFLMFVH